MQEIKLTTENSDTVHVDSVDVSKGIIAKRGTSLYWVVFQNDGYNLIDYLGDIINYSPYESITYMIKSRSADHFFTIPDNRRIVTEKPLTVEPNSIIGIDYADGTKGWIVSVDGEYHAISFEQKLNVPNRDVAAKDNIAKLIDLLLMSGSNRLFLFAAYDEKWIAWLTKK